jgi:hypothetical protein
VSLTGSTLLGTDAANYILSFTGAPVSTANITQANLSVTGITASSKTYDATTAATLGGTPAVTPLLSDLVTPGGTPSGTFADKNTGITKPITITGVTISGTDAANYNLIQQTGLTADIISLTVTIGGSFIAGNKVYDATTDAAISTNLLTLVTKAGSDVVNLSPVATFADKNIGTGKIVSLTGTTLTGADAGNYTLSLTGAPTATANITPLTLTIGGSFTVSSKVYDATNSATISSNGLTLATIAGSDIVTLNAVAVFANKITGTGKTVGLAGSSISGADAGNYTLSLTGSPTATANITRKTLTVGGSFTASNKVYDANTSASIATNSLIMNTIAGSDTVNLNAVAVFANKLIGTGKTVSLTGSSLAGADAGNYTLSLTGSPVSTANITPLTVTIGGSFTVSNKVYDASSSATISTNSLTLLTKAGSDGLSLTAVAVFANKLIGSAKTVSLAGSTLAGADAGNYTLSLTGAPTATANITAKALTVTGIVAKNRSYDGTNVASLNTTANSLVGVLGSEIVKLDTSSYTASFTAKTIGAGKPVTVSGLALTGADAGNYTLTQPTGLTANIVAKPLTVTLSVNDKLYDCTVTATLNTTAYILNGIVGTETVTLNSSAYTASFNNLSVGLDKPVTVSGLTLSGADAGNYTLTQPAGLTASIERKTLTVTVDNISKSYGDPNPAFTVSYTGFAPCDDIYVVTIPPTVSTTATQFSDINTYPLIPSGAFASNYSFIYVNGTLTVTKASLTVTANNKSRIYGDNNPVLDLAYSGFRGTDTKAVLDVEPTVSTSAVKTSNAGTYSITVTGGSDNNYTYTYVNGTLTVNKAPLRIFIHNMRKFQGDAVPTLAAYIYKNSDFKFAGDNSTLDFSMTLSATCTAASVPGNYVIDFPTAPVDNNYVVTDTSFNTPYKKGIFYVHPKISITAQPSQQKACEYLNVQFTFTNTGVFQKYLWQVKKRATDSFHYIISTDSLSHKGDSTAVLTVDPIISANNGFQFQCSIISEFWEDSLATTKTLRSNSLTTNPATLVVDKSPPQSPVLKKGNMLICSNDSVTAWQWGDAAGTISGQTKQYFTPTDISNFKKYWVLTTNKSGCTTKVYFNDDPPFDWHAYGVKIAPTPNNGTFTVTASGLTANTLIQVEVYDLKGNKYSNSAKKQTTGTELIIQSSEINGGTKLKPGFYFIVVSQTIVSGPSKVYKRGVGKIIVNSN